MSLRSATERRGWPGDPESQPLLSTSGTRAAREAVDRAPTQINDALTRPSQPVMHSVRRTSNNSLLQAWQVPVAEVQSELQSVIQSEPPRVSWTASVPQNLRLRVLDLLATQPLETAVQRDLSSFACAARTARQDVRDYLRTSGNLRASLLASRNLVHRAGDIAKRGSWFSRIDRADAVLADMAPHYPAAIVGAVDFTKDDVPVAMRAIAKLIGAGASYLHVRLGSTENGRFSWNDHQWPEVLDVLIESTVARLEKGSSPPSLYLSMQGVDPEALKESIDASPVPLPIVGISMCPSVRCLIDYQEIATGLISPSPSEFERWILPKTWANLLSKLHDLKSIRLNGWNDIGLTEALTEFVKTAKFLEEIDLSACALNPDKFEQFLGSLSEGRLPLKRLILDQMGWPMPAHRLAPEICRLLENHQDLQVILGPEAGNARVPALEPFRLNGRLRYEIYPSAMRDLPEIYGAANLMNAPKA